MTDPNLQVQAVAHHVIVTDEKRVVPPLENPVIFDFELSHMRRVILEDPKENWSAENPLEDDFITTRYSQGMDFVRWFKVLWNEPVTNQQLIARLKNLLRDTYLAGDVDARECIVNGYLEHLYESRGIRKYFSDWDADPVLRGASEMAKKWRAEADLSE